MERLSNDSIGYEDTLTVYIWMDMDLSLASDTIVPCDSSWLVKGDTRLTSEFIQYPEIKNNVQMFDGDPMLLACAFAILSSAFIHYLYYNFHIIRNIIIDIFGIIKS